MYEPKMPEYLVPHFRHVASRARELHGITLDEKSYMYMLRLAKDWREPENAQRVAYLRSVDANTALLAMKLRFDDGNLKFIPVVIDRHRHRAIDVLPMGALDRYGRMLHYVSNVAHDAYRTTRASFNKNGYHLNEPFTFDVYIKMCEQCRTGKAEVMKFRSSVRRLRIKSGQAMMPVTIYVHWDDNEKLITGTMKRSMVEMILESGKNA
jgi:hypothetical protein